MTARSVRERPDSLPSPQQLRGVRRGRGSHRSRYRSPWLSSRRLWDLGFQLHSNPLKSRRAQGIRPLSEDALDIVEWFLEQRQRRIPSLRSAHAKSRRAWNGLSITSACGGSSPRPRSKCTIRIQRKHLNRGGRSSALIRRVIKVARVNIRPWNGTVAALIRFLIKGLFMHRAESNPVKERFGGWPSFRSLGERAVRNG